MSKLGIGVTILALTMMPVLGRAKRRNANLPWRQTPFNRPRAYIAVLTLPGLIVKCDATYPLG